MDKKIFIVTGEVSGDKLGAWYLKRLNVPAFALGGTHLEQAGASLYGRMEDLNVVGVTNIIKKAPFLLNYLKTVAHDIIKYGIEEVILVDFPGFNMRLAKKLKRQAPHIKITYLSPPQLWAWGAWRLRSLKKYCDRIIVIYPFEVAWYRERGVTAEFIGSPHVEALKQHFEACEHKEPVVAWLPGSRPGELAEMFASMAEVIKKFKKAYPAASVVIVRAESFSRELISRRLHEVGLNDVAIVEGNEKYKVLSACSLALAKPGTSTLELALLKIPTVVMYKTSWITYLLARPLVKITSMTLPNLLVGKKVFSEFIQGDCSVDAIAQEMTAIYKQFSEHDTAYAQRTAVCQDVRDVLSGKEIIVPEPRKE